MFGTLFGSVGGAVLDKVLGRNEGRSNLQQGHEQDVKWSLHKENELWSRAEARGLTPQEYYGSAAPGAGGTSGGGQVLGSQTNVQNQLKYDMYNKEMDRKTTLGVARINADAQKYSADQSRQATQDQVTGNVAVQELRNLMEDRKINILEREFEEIRLRAAQASLDLTREQIKKAVNEVVTSTPKYQREMKLLSMGFDNTIQTMILNRAGVSDPKDMSKLTEEEYEALLQTMLGHSSTLGRELKGIVQSVKDLINFLQGLPKKDNPFSGPTIGSAPR